MKLTKAILGFVFGLSFASAATAITPPYVTISPYVNGQANPTYGGTGCPYGTARAVVSPDFQSFTMIYDQYVVNIAGANAMDRKNCQILVTLNYPQGWSYSVVRMDYRGYYDLSSGATATQQSLFYFQGDTRQATLSTPFVGPTNGNYTLSAAIGVNSLVWSPCGTSAGLNINSSIVARVNSNNPHGYAYMTTDSTDGSVRTSYALQWRRCQ